MFEIERKFKLKEMITQKDIDDISFMKEEFIQTYFRDDDGENKRVRIHHSGIDLKTGKKIHEKAILCKKKVVDIIDNVEVREELESPLNMDEAKSIILNNLHSTFYKTRNYINLDKFVLEIDSFPNLWTLDKEMLNEVGELKVVEVEFKDKTHLEEFKQLTLPSFIGDEVTGDKRYNNSTLAFMKKNDLEVEKYVKKFMGIKMKNINIL
jgi:hypothetical protein